jgi:hypothetical protein
MDASNTAAVAIRPEPHLVAGTLPVRDLDQVSR